MLRGVEMLSSLQNIIKPFYLKNLSRDQSEDLGRAGEMRFMIKEEVQCFNFLGNISVKSGRLIF